MLANTPACLTFMCTLSSLFALLGGASVRIIDPKWPDNVLIESMTVLSIGLTGFGGDLVRVVRRNSWMPTTKHRYATTAVDNQDSVILRVVEGELAAAQDDLQIGSLYLTDLPPRRAGNLTIEFVLEIDVDGVISVGARQLGSAQLAGSTLGSRRSDWDAYKSFPNDPVGPLNLPEEFVESMIRQAEASGSLDRGPIEYPEPGSTPESAIPLPPVPPELLHESSYAGASSRPSARPPRAMNDTD